MSLGYAKQLNRLEDEIKELKAQRDELLEACNDFVNAVRAGSKQEIMLAIDAADKKARAAIEKAKGVENETAT